MPYNCPVCNNDDYNEIDGHFFCTECQTQSQELIVQEVSGDTEVNFRCEVKVAEAGTHTLTKKPKVDLGRPWTIYEAYQIIILAQVDGLIEQGASQDLKDIVFTIWANYLSNLGVAFCSKEKLVPDVVTRTRIGRRRELHRGTFSNPLNRRKRPFSERSSKGCHETSHLMGETFYDDDNPVDEINDNIVFLDDSNGANKTQAAKRFAARRSRVAKSPEWMDMNKTIAICYIGLMFTNRNILPIDVVRFVYESKVPFLSVTHLLPPDMVLSARDKALFESSRFDTKTLSAEVSRLLSYMKLEVMPTPDLDVIIPCFVHQLCLPDELATYSLHLVEMIPFVWQNKASYKKHDMLAMAYIILSLKISMGLDDSTERQLSRYSKKLQDMLEATTQQQQQQQQLFIWRDWVQFITQTRASNFCAYREITGDIIKSKVQHVDQLVDCYSKTASDKRKHTTWKSVNRHGCLVRSYQTEFRHALRRPLEIALDRLGNEKSHGKQDAVCDVQQQVVCSTKGHNFQDCTMNHIVNISLFQTQVVGEMSPDHKVRFDKFWMKYSLPRTNVIQYNLIKDGDILMSHRHESYIWLLNLTSQIIDCSVSELDKLVVHLLNYLATLSTGTVPHGLMCSQIGDYFPSKKTLRKVASATAGSAGHLNRSYSVSKKFFDKTSSISTGSEDL